MQRRGTAITDEPSLPSTPHVARHPPSLGPSGLAITDLLAGSRLEHQDGQFRPLLTHAVRQRSAGEPVQIRTRSGTLPRQSGRRVRPACPRLSLVLGCPLQHSFPYLLAVAATCVRNINCSRPCPAPRGKHRCGRALLNDPLPFRNEAAQTRADATRRPRTTRVAPRPSLISRKKLADHDL